MLLFGLIALFSSGFVMALLPVPRWMPWLLLALPAWIGICGYENEATNYDMHGLSLDAGAFGVALMAATVGTGELLHYVFVQSCEREWPAWGGGALFIVAVLSVTAVVGLWVLMAGSGSILPLEGLLLGLVVARVLCGLALRRDLFSGERALCWPSQRLHPASPS
jgi:hypothetical protein